MSLFRNKGILFLVSNNKVLFRSLHSTVVCNRYKKKWVEMGRKKVQASELALAYFDTYYPQLYGVKCWEEMRDALLRKKKKYCALVNNFANSMKTVNELISEHQAFDMFTITGEALKVPCMDRPRSFSVESQAYKVPSGQDVAFDLSEVKLKPGPVTYEETPEGFVIPRQAEVPKNKPYYPPDLYDYIPAERRVSEKEAVQDQLERQAGLLSTQPVVDIIPCEALLVPPMLKCHVHVVGHVRDFWSPQQDETKLLQYYLMDASSVLPVIALDLRPNDKVLDLCSGPGGKSLVMAQTLITDKIVCVDASFERLRRLRDVLRSYIPGVQDNFEQMSKPIEMMREDGRVLGDIHSSRYDKVLVDVPCNTDRLALHDNEHNRFKRTRVTERLQLPHLQAELLMSGIKACKPGGNIVYSTCTLTPGQNDYVVESAIQQLRSANSTIEVVVQDTSNIVTRLSHVFRFWPEPRYGQLVLPTAEANFGPTYFAKLVRVK